MLKDIFGEVGATTVAFARCDVRTGLGPKKRPSSLEGRFLTGTDTEEARSESIDNLSFDKIDPGDGGGSDGAAAAKYDEQWSHNPRNRTVEPLSGEVERKNCNEDEERLDDSGDQYLQQIKPWWRAHEEDPNRAVTDRLSTCDLFVFCYVCNETSGCPSGGGRNHTSGDPSGGGHDNHGLAFYRDLARRAKPGAVFLFADVQQHSRPALDAVCQAMTYETTEGGGRRRSRVERLPLDPGLARSVKSELMVLYVDDPDIP